MMTATQSKPPRTMSEVRAWAREQGISVNPNGNLPNDVIEAFNKRHRARPFERAVRKDLQTR